MTMGSKPDSGLPTQAAPTKVDRPTPKMVRARPVATWLALKPSATAANSSDSSMPAAMASNTPSHRLPVLKATIKPITAPNSIMPSWPRLSTPLFSHTSSPRATSSSGVPVRTMA